MFDPGLQGSHVLSREKSCEFIPESDKNPLFSCVDVPFVCVSVHATCWCCESVCTRLVLK